MRKLILVITLLAAATSANAFKIIKTTPEILVSAGASISEDNKTVSLKFTGQEILCYSVTQVCFNGSIMFLTTDSTLNTSQANDEFNFGGGFDIKYKLPKKINNSFYVEAGPYAFVKGLNGYGDKNVNIHIGAGVEYESWTLSIDAYGRNEPLYMINGGYRF